MISYETSRRRVLGVLGVSAVLAAAEPLSGGMTSAQAAEPKSQSAKGSVSAPRGSAQELVYIGTWQGSQIYAARFDTASGELTPVGPVGAANADWSVPHPRLPILYAATMDEGGVVYSFAIDPVTGVLTETGRVATGGAGLGGGGVAYLGIDEPSATLLVSNYEGGLTAAVPISPTGTLGAPASIAQDVGSGPNPRQAGPHAHHVEIAPDGRFALVSDFGADRVFVYRFDRATRILSAGGSGGPYFYATAPGSGPRRVAFHPGHRSAYLLSELTAELETLNWDGATGQLTKRQSLSLVSSGFTGTPSSSDLVVSTDGRFLYAGNRAENSLTAFAVDPRTDLLTEVQRIDCGGVKPWGFSIHADGRWLLVANEASNSVNVFGIDRQSGLLTDTGHSISVPNPDSITFYRSCP
ncbi:conserved hypothetical protein [Catenulispora acidiphila DSM 44928]|uniref:6-phosphogluconolactonase n=1 Tax=Catenulispora acidiphila (strain DSM 44928 / JCM 14897 / NBRC 102108 / NRRL B-24433 / ID139908) TaxID=479433 RepID=C7QEP0_CATAD|nr:lactonase family protein [Catenulispora acidiphila]ACU72810.1 conserved hypothetical protein [Catenulispora acidiphila DSM 44928]